MSSAAKKTGAADGPAPAATWLPTEAQSAAVNEPLPPTPRTPDVTPTNVVGGSTHGRNGLEFGSPPSSPSVEPSKPSTKRWRQPKNVREFAAQANLVSTAILNGEIDLDTARAYSAVARTVAQSVTSEVVRARFLRAMPDLTFPDMTEDE